MVLFGYEIDYVFMNTDWFMFGATIFAGIVSAVATIAAVIYSNIMTRKQLLEEQKRLDKKSQYVVITPILQLTSFMLVLNTLLVSNDYNRILLFSGEDGFDFYDDCDKRNSHTQRLLRIQNNSTCDIKNICLKTNTTLVNTDTNEQITYNTTNQLNLLRSKESIIIRIKDEKQLLKICEMNASGIGSKILFRCDIIYETFADQQITYVYQVKIINDRQVEVIKDGVESVKDIVDILSEQPEQTVFRNLQDTISTIDRSDYYWKKMGGAQFSGALPLFQYIQQNNMTNSKMNVDGLDDNKQNI